MGMANYVPIGPRMRDAARYVQEHRGCTVGEVARAVGPWGSTRYGYRTVQRAIKAGLIVDLRSGYRSELYPGPVRVPGWKEGGKVMSEPVPQPEPTPLPVPQPNPPWPGPRVDVPAQCSCPGDCDGGHSWNCRYAGVPEEIEHCCVCNKVCWHIGGPYFCDSHHPAPRAETTW